MATNTQTDPRSGWIYHWLPSEPKPHTEIVVYHDGARWQYVAPNDGGHVPISLCNHEVFWRLGLGSNAVHEDSLPTLLSQLENRYPGGAGNPTKAADIERWIDDNALDYLDVAAIWDAEEFLNPAIPAIADELEGLRGADLESAAEIIALDQIQTALDQEIVMVCNDGRTVADTLLDYCREYWESEFTLA